MSEEKKQNDILLINLENEIHDLFLELDKMRTEKSKADLGTNGFASEIFYQALWQIAMDAISEMHKSGKFDRCHKLMELCARLDDNANYVQGRPIRKATAQPKP